jgi:hypothetical protein
VLQGLSTLPSLRDLSISSLDTSALEQLVVGLPGVVVLNGVSLVPHDADGSSSHGNSSGNSSGGASAGGTAVGYDARAPAERGDAGGGGGGGDGGMRQRCNTGDSTASLGDGDVPVVVREVTMTEGDVEAVAVLFGALRGVATRSVGGDDTAAAAVFDGHVKTVVAGLKNRLESVRDPFLRQSEILAVRRLRRPAAAAFRLPQSWHSERCHCGCN